MTSSAPAQLSMTSTTKDPGRPERGISLLDILGCPRCKGPVGKAADHLECSPCRLEFPLVDGTPIMLENVTDAAIEHQHPLKTRKEYASIFTDIIDSFTTDQIVVDIGSGNMAHDHPQMIAMDLQPGPHVDVVADMHALPFRADSVDFIMGFALLEHLRRPAVAVKEAWECLKPGGYIYAECNFVFPYHGVPDHYFNASISGLREWFAPFRELKAGVAPWQMPSFTIGAATGFAPATPRLSAQRVICFGSGCHS